MGLRLPKNPRLITPARGLPATAGFFLSIDVVPTAMRTEEFKEKTERTCGDIYVRWYNDTNGTNFIFSSGEVQSTDLLYVDGLKKLPIQVTLAFYNQDHAATLNRWVKKDPKARPSEHIVEPGQLLIETINSRLAEKCLMSYDANCHLIVIVQPSATAISEFDGLLRNISVPTNNPFAVIMVGGDFPDPLGWHWRKIA